MRERGTEGVVRLELELNQPWVRGPCGPPFHLIVLGRQTFRLPVGFFSAPGKGPGRPWPPSYCSSQLTPDSICKRI